MESKNCLYMYSCKRLPQHENVVDVLTLISKKSKFAATASVIGDVAIIAGGGLLLEDSNCNSARQRNRYVYPR